MVHFFTEDIAFALENSNKLAVWVSAIIDAENKTAKTINYIFCSDSYLLDKNLTYLNHNTYTDIVTFDNSESLKEVEADIFISIDRVKENAMSLNVSFQNELHRVMIHGILHLLGQHDKSAIEKKEMRKKEEACLSLRQL